MPRKTVINCKRGTKSLYDQIKKTRYFKGCELGLIFCLATAIGFKRKKFDCFTQAHSGGLIRVEWVENNTDSKRFIEAIAISHHGSLDVFSDEKKIYEIAIVMDMGRKILKIIEECN